MEREINGFTFERFEQGETEFVRVDSWTGATLVLPWDALVQFMAEERAEGPGELFVALTPDERMVHIQFPPTAESVGWMRLTPDEACQLAELLLKKAVEAMR